MPLIDNNYENEQNQQKYTSKSEISTLRKESTIRENNYYPGNFDSKDDNKAASKDMDDKPSLSPSDNGSEFEKKPKIQLGKIDYKDHDKEKYNINDDFNEVYEGENEDLMDRLKFLKNNILQKDISFKEKMDFVNKIENIQEQIQVKAKNYIEKDSILELLEELKYELRNKDFGIFL